MPVRIIHEVEGIEFLPKEDQKKLRGKIRGKAYRDRHPKRVKELSRKRARRTALQENFGLSLEQYEAILKNQNNCCALCGFIPYGEDTHRHGKSLAVDHDHNTGRVRGLLCDLCNRGLGQLKDEPNLLRKAADYIERSREPLFVPWGEQPIAAAPEEPSPLRGAPPGQGRIELPIKEIEKLYNKGKGLTTIEIGKFFGVCKTTVTRRMQEAGIWVSSRGGGKKRTPDNPELLEYLTQ